MRHPARLRVLSVLSAIVAFLYGTGVASAASWHVSPTPNVGTADNSLWALGVLAPNNAWAVGAYYDPSTFAYPTLIEHWNGASWSVVPSPSPGGSNGLYAVARVPCNPSCNGQFYTNTVWTVGTTFDTNLQLWRTLIEHYDGTSWSVVPSPNSGNVDNYLYGATAVASNDVWADGAICTSQCGTSSETDQTLIEHWNGSSWSIVPSPNPDPTSNRLIAMAAIPCSGSCHQPYYSNNLWAVGFTPSGALDEQWNGSTWSGGTLPTAGLLGVDAFGPTDVWAAGYGTTAHWNGTAWTIVPPATVIGAIGLMFNAVVSIRPNDVWALGTYYTSTGTNLTLAEQWNGTSWSVSSMPTLSSTDAQLNGGSAVPCANVSCSPYKFTSVLGAVGLQYTPGVDMRSGAGPAPPARVRNGHPSTSTGQQTLAEYNR